jgi:hypothetical protein
MSCPRAQQKLSGPAEIGFDLAGALASESVNIPKKNCPGPESSIERERRYPHIRTHPQHHPSKASALRDRRP